MPFLVSLSSGIQRWEYRALVLAWLLGQLSFWTWWLRGDHLVTPVGLFINSLLLLWTTFLPAWYLFFLGRVKRPNPAQPLPDGRVAMVVTKAPSEPWPVVRRTLNAMLAQSFPRPYDVWLADEDPSSETRAWCTAHGVQISCRKGVAGFNNTTWPRRQKCKEGNLAYFYEAMGGYDQYDFVSQLDADHVPERGYLAEMIRPFGNPRVGYVAAPSMCDTNAAESWAARGRLHAEAAWHGSVQAGFNEGFAPQCIGSHYAVRTTALRQIGGLGPELAEDFSTTLAMNAAGWDGAFALDAAAHGDGPASVADSIVQEFQWSRSVVNILLTLWSSQRGKLSRHVRIQLGFAQLWYFLFTLHLSVAYLLPIVALIWGTPWVNVDFVEFLVRATLPVVSMVLTLAWVRRQGWLRPKDAPILSWEAVLFELVRWPWMLFGIVQAVVGHLMRKNFTFRVTPKGGTGPQPLPRRVLLPYVVIVLAEAGAALLIDKPGEAAGYTYLALFAALTYTGVIAALVGLHLRETRRSFRVPWHGQLGALVRLSPGTVVAVALSGAAVMTRGETALSAVLPSVMRTEPMDASAAAAPPFALAPEVDAMAALSLPTDHVAIGAYDPSNVMANTDLDVEQHYVHQSDPAAFERALDDAGNRRTPLITVEPWPAAGSTDPTGLRDVVDGASDQDLEALAAIAAAHSPQTILLRWGHEMELSDVYPWGAQSPDLYVTAYRHMHEIFVRTGASNVRFVWAPAGNENAAQYFPGDDVVDYIGVTVLEDPVWDANFGLPPQSFDDIFGPRYRRLVGYAKPVIIAELGVSGVPDHQAAWLAAATESFAAYPGLAAVVYFDAVNPPLNQLPIEPDWRLDAAALGMWHAATVA